MNTNWAANDNAPCIAVSGTTPCCGNCKNNFDDQNVHRCWHGWKC